MTRYWQDLQPGEHIPTGALTLSGAALREFAAEFDPQPYHLDSAVADQSIFGGLCASGWQVAAMMMRLLSDGFRAADIALMGVLAVPRMRWKIPVFAGDSLAATITLGARSEDSGRAGLGLVEAALVGQNQHDKAVLELQARLLVAHAPATAGGERPPPGKRR